MKKISIKPFLGLLLTIIFSGFTARAYSQDLMPIKNQMTRNFGYMDDSGNAVIKAQFYKASTFSNGIAIVSDDALDDYCGAISDYTKALTINPKYAETYHQRGMVKAQLKDFNGAIAEFSKVIDINPNKKMLMRIIIEVRIKKNSKIS